ncbi:hypothetical protein AAC387_Pa03g3961 [Persea americana]
MENILSYANLFLIWLVSTLIVRAILSKRRPTPRQPPSPIALPIIGHLHLLGPFPHQSFHKIATRYGPLFRLRLGSVPFVIASSPDTAKEILKTHEISFASRPISSAVRYLSYDCCGFIFAPYGPFWKFIKNLTVSELLGGRTIEMVLPIRRQELQRFLQLLMKRSDAGEAVDVSAELSMMTKNVVSMMAIRKRCSRTEGDNDVQKLLIELSEIVGRFNLADYNWVCKKLDVQGIERQYKDLHLKLDGIFEGIIKEHEVERKARREMDAGGDYAKDLLDMMLDISEDEKAEMKLTREGIKAFIQVHGPHSSPFTTPTPSLPCPVCI